MAIKLPPDKIVKAHWFTSWNFIFSKATFICGGCYREFKTRSLYPFDRTTPGKKEGITANCPHCGKWNVVKGVKLND